jgi:glycosyltransferase involved in cell wall biosynthesis
VDPARVSLITAVICTRNRGAAVAQTVRTVLLNDYPHFRIVVVDQSDDERSREALRPFLDTPRVTYLRMATRGLAAGRNLGIHAAPRSEYIAITDDDCVAPPNWLSAMVQAFSVDARIGLVFGNVAPGPHDRAAGFVPAYERSEPFLARGMRDKHEVEGIGGCMGLRRDVWQALGGFDEMLGLGAHFPAGEEGGAVVHRNWFGTGAMLVKHLRCGHWSVAALLVRIAWRWAFARSRAAASLGTRSHTWMRLRAFLSGMLAGLCAPVNRRNAQFQKNSDRSLGER